MKKQQTADSRASTWVSTSGSASTTAWAWTKTKMELELELQSETSAAAAGSIFFLATNAVVAKEIDDVDEWTLRKVIKITLEW